MLDRSLRLLGADAGIGVGGCFIANEHRIALAVIMSAFGSRTDLDQTAITIAGVTGADPLAHDG